MKLTMIDYLFIISFIGLNLIIGLFLSKKAGKSLKTFFTGGNNLPWWIIGTSMVATTFGADTPIAVAEIVANDGISGNWVWWSMLAGGILTTFFFAKNWRKSGVLTDLEFITLRYSGKPALFLRGFRAIYFGVFLNVIIMGWVNLALLSVLKVFTDIPEDQLLYYIGGAMLFVAIYSSISGILGVIYTDILQFILAMVGCIVLAVIVLNTDQVGGIAGLKEKLPAQTFDFFPTIGEKAEGSIIGKYALGFWSFFAFVGITWWASWYPGNEPGGGGYIAQRMLSAKNEKHAVGATLFFQIAHYALRPWPWIIVGLCAIVLYPNLGDGEKGLGFVYAMRDFLPNGLKGILIVSFLAAYMSTISTHLNWGASYLINDFYKNNFGRNDDAKKQVMFSRAATLLLMVLAILVTSQLESIKGAWVFLMECGAGLGLVLILRWYWWRINAWSELAATIAPFIGLMIAKFYFQHFHPELGIHEFPGSLFFVVSFTTITWIAATYLTRPTEESVLHAFVEKIGPDGWWGPFRRPETSKDKANMLYLVICWISAIVAIYSFLFLIGSMIFQDQSAIILYGGLTIVSGLVLYVTTKKAKILSD